MSMKAIFRTAFEGDEVHGKRAYCFVLHLFSLAHGSNYREKRAWRHQLYQHEFVNDGSWDGGNWARLVAGNLRTGATSSSQSLGVRKSP